MTRYAASTAVPSDRSRNEIERTLQRYGADEFAYGWADGQVVIMFRAQSRRVKFILPMPNPASRDITHTPQGYLRTRVQQQALVDQATRQRWRALLLVIKAKLEAVESGIVTFEQEFGMHMLLPDGQTVSQWQHPQITEAYERGTMPRLLG